MTYLDRLVRGIETIYEPRASDIPCRVEHGRPILEFRELQYPAEDWFLLIAMLGIDKLHDLQCNIPGAGFPEYTPAIEFRPAIVTKPYLIEHWFLNGDSLPAIKVMSPNRFIIILDHLNKTEHLTAG